MDYRNSTFKTKFENAAKYLKGEPKEIVSLKLRDSVGSYREYDMLMDILKREAHVQTSPVKDGLQGDGYLIQHRDNRIIVVSHETGLEILYIAGSIASIIGLIPLVLKCWNHLRGGMGRQFHPHNIEIRRFDEKGHLIEQDTHGLFGDFLNPFDLTNGLLTSSVEGIEGELRQLKSDVQELTVRVDEIEKAQSRKRNLDVTKSSKKKQNRKA
jgi:hypothetical protein